MAEDEQPDLSQEAVDGGGAGGYEAPRLSIYDGDALVAWASDKAGENPPDDTLSAATRSGGDPKVLGWIAPDAAYVYGGPATFTAPENPELRTSPSKTTPKKTTKAGKTTGTHATKTRLTGQDAFGGALCTCDLVCTCNLVCTCEVVATCSCVSQCSCVSDAGGGTTPPCSCDTQCPCVSHSSGCVIVCPIEG